MTTIRLSAANFSDVNIHTEGGVVTGLDVVVSAVYINDNGDPVTTVLETMEFWSTLPEVKKTELQTTVNNLNAAIQIRYFSA